MSANIHELDFQELRVFLVDDDDLIAQVIVSDLGGRGAVMERANSVRQAFVKYRSFKPDVIVTDLNLPDGNGLDLLKLWRKDDPSTPIIMITAHAGIDSAITALRLGAFDYLQKPFAMQDLVAAVRRAGEVGNLRRKVDLYEGKEKRLEPTVMIGESSAMRRLKTRLGKVANSKVDTVLIYGESGSGKELVARLTHELSDRSREPFVEINCASIPENLLESELFGYEKGAFTDARDRKLGLLEIAGKGTLFLDEIGEMPLKMQAKLLRVLEYRRFKRLGGIKDVEFNARIVAATNRRLEEEIVENRFREDLYYRLNVISVVVPPLRDRREDIPLIVDFLLERVADSLGVKKPELDAGALDLLCSQSWRGNVRELKNVLQRSLVFGEKAILGADDLEFMHLEGRKADDLGAESQAAPSLVKPMTASSNLFVLPPEGISLEELEKSLLVQALETTRYNQSKACRLLGITRHTLRYRLEKFGLLETLDK